MTALKKNVTVHKTVRNVFRSAVHTTHMQVGNRQYEWLGKWYKNYNELQIDFLSMPLNALSRNTGHVKSARNIWSHCIYSVNKCRNTLSAEWASPPRSTGSLSVHEVTQVSETTKVMQKKTSIYGRVWYLGWLHTPVYKSHERIVI